MSHPDLYAQVFNIGFDINGNTIAHWRVFDGEERTITRSGKKRVQIGAGFPNHCGPLDTWCEKNGYKVSFYDGDRQTRYEYILEKI